LSRGGQYNQTPAWQPDGGALAIARQGEGIFLREADGSERLLVNDPSGPGRIFLRNMAWTPDGRQLLYVQQSAGSHDIWLLTLDDGSPPQPLLQNSWSDHSPRVSPDGDWLAYVSDESGTQEVWVQPFPQGERRRVSRTGGTGPVWSHDGSELHFQTFGSAPQLMVVPVTTAGGRLTEGEAAPLLDLRVTGPTGLAEQYALSLNSGPRYDVLRDGRFVMIRGADPQGTREIVLVQHFDEEARRLTRRR
jgi:eukaryotic-like serine/threonine-protein kinase